MSIDFRLLGEVEAIRDGLPLVLGPVRPRSVLVALLVDANSPVSLDELVSRVWGLDAPGQVRSSVHSYFTRLRSALAGEATIVRRGHGYVLQADPDAIDIHRFRRLAERGHASDQAAEALRHFDAALTIWRGEPFPGLVSPWLNEVRAALEAEHASILLDRTDARLELGQHNELIVELSQRAARQPLNERLAAQLMLALYRNDRQADALLHFEKVRAELAGELGVDPGSSLRRLHQSILRESPELDLPRTSPSRPDRPWPLVPRQLPAGPPTFVGRQSELANLTAALTPAEDASRVAVVVGSGGMGKTSLALHWAHRNLNLFPDGQLFVDLRGFAPSRDRVSPYHAMRNFLVACQVDPHTIPADPDAMTGLYRSLLADKRMLIVIDNVRDAEQVSALVPGTPHCAVLATSRNRITGLVASHNATMLPVDSLPEDDARALLTARLGVPRATAEPDAIRQLAVMCGGLPLALAIAASRAQEHPDFPLTALVDELSDAGSALNALEIDTELSFRTVLSTSYAGLTADQTEVFTRLGPIIGTDIGLAEASALIGLPMAATRARLRELEKASLLQQHAPGRFRIHNLVALYAREQASAVRHDGQRCLLRRHTSRTGPPATHECADHPGGSAPHRSPPPARGPPDRSVSATAERAAQPVAAAVRW